MNRISLTDELIDKLVQAAHDAIDHVAYANYPHRVEEARAMITKVLEETNE